MTGATHRPRTQRVLRLSRKSYWGDYYRRWQTTPYSDDAGWSPVQRVETQSLAAHPLNAYACEIRVRNAHPDDDDDDRGGGRP